LTATEEFGSSNPRRVARIARLKHHRNIQVNFRVSSKWLRLVQMLARLEGRTPSALMRELLTIGLAQYVTLYYRTPQLVRQQELKSVFTRQRKVTERTKGHPVAKR